MEENKDVNKRYQRDREWKPELDPELKKGKIELPKRKYALIHGYNGHKFKGNQKNPGIRTVEEEIEKVLFKLNYISECNFGTLQKIAWSRASRTDKRVSAVFNMISCKLHKQDETEDEMKDKINKELPEDIKIFKIIEISKSFDAKASNNNREYHYILPSFCLKPRSLEESKTDYTMDTYKGDFSFKISPEYREKIQKICDFFKGSRRYHNYTKKMLFTDASTNRHIYEVTVSELIEFENFQAVKFKIVGQSFLYNQIRKMIGFVIEMCRESLDSSIIENTFKSNKMDIPKAPAEGLYLYKIDYSRYNSKKQNKKSEIALTEQDEIQTEEFKRFIVAQIEKAEINEKAFSKWMFLFDHVKNEIY